MLKGRRIGPHRHGDRTMKNVLTKTGLAVGLGAAALATAAPAQARDYYYGRHHDNTAAVAVGAGIIGLAVGALIASSNNHDRYDRYDNRYDRRYDRRYYRGYGYNNDYYRRGYRNDYGYDRGYYGYRGY
jgi:hypothetical protein